MKKLFLSCYILSTLLLVVFCISCSDELNQKPISSSTTVTFYQSTSDFTQGVNAIYADLRAYPNRLLNLSETRSDNIYGVSDGGVRDWDGVNDFKTTLASNPYISEAWLTNFNGIYRANVILDQIEKNGSIITDSTLRKRLTAEAKFLRAFYYFDLVRWFGKVPLIQQPITVAEAVNITRSPVGDVYDLIIADLQYAIINLSKINATADKGRATAYAAQGMLALVYMTRSGPTYDVEGPGINSNEWEKALTLLNSIIDSKLYSFLPNYSNIFSYGNENNGEVIFDVEFISGSSPLLGSGFPGLLAPDSYFLSLGKVVQGGLTIRPVSNTLISAFDTADVRKKFAIQSGYTYNGTSESRSFFKKYIDITKIPALAGDFPINFIVLRYTNILMLKAECILHGASGTQSDVDAVVNQVRLRAGLTTTLTDVTMEQLMDERQKEFMAEGSRWHDLVRSGLVTTVIPQWITAEDVLLQINPFQTNFVIYPIPQSEIDVKTGLYTQNNGYQ